MEWKSLALLHCRAAVVAGAIRTPVSLEEEVAASSPRRPVDTAREGAVAEQGAAACSVVAARARADTEAEACLALMWESVARERPARLEAVEEDSLLVVEEDLKPKVPVLIFRTNQS